MNVTSPETDAMLLADPSGRWRWYGTAHGWHYHTHDIGKPAGMDGCEACDVAEAARGEW